MATEQPKTRSTSQPAWARPAKGDADKTCTLEGCGRPYRAKGYCFFHYKKWRQGDLPHSRYRTCSKTECRNRVAKGGLCEKHYAETYTPAGEPAASA